MNGALAARFPREPRGVEVATADAPFAAVAEVVGHPGEDEMFNIFDGGRVMGFAVEPKVVDAGPEVVSSPVNVLGLSPLGPVCAEEG